MKKKVLAIVLVLAMVFSLVACSSGSSGTSSNDSSSGSNSTSGTDSNGEKDTSNDGNTGTNTESNGGASTSGGVVSNNPLDTLVVGTSELNGDFIDGFGNNAYDNYVKIILHSYCDTYHITDAGELELSDTIVTDLQTDTDDAGNKTYTFTLTEDLKWSNGEPIMAKDYVATVLHHASPEWLAAGASSTLGEGLVGYSAYYNGETTDFAGVQLLGDYQFSLTIDAEELPYFYETVYVGVGPIYMPTYVPGATVVSDENGSHFEWEDGKDLKTACEDVAAGERFAPTVVSGPYKFVSFENQIATLELNEYFKCDYEGNVPTLKYVIVRNAPTETDIDMVLAGDVDLLPGVIEGNKIEAAKSSDVADMNSYFRNGYGLMAMMCDWGPTADPNVRWALACLLDRSAVIDYVLGGYGGTVDSEYGLAQWTYQEKAADLAEMLRPITFNIETANDYLDQSEWKYESDGTTPFDRTKANADGTYMRYNSKGEMLTIEHFGSEGNSVTDVIEIQYASNAPLAGVKFNVTKGDFNVLLSNYYYSYEMSDEERIYSTFNLANNFAMPDDKYLSSWHSDYCGTWLNATQLSDSELDSFIIGMRKLDPEQTDEYADLWLQYEVRWQELLPNIPLYSNEYFDIYHVVVDGVETTPFWSWSYIICKLSKSAK